MIFNYFEQARNYGQVTKTYSWIHEDIEDNISVYNTCVTSYKLTQVVRISAEMGELMPLCSENSSRKGTPLLGMCFATFVVFFDVSDIYISEF